MHKIENYVARNTHITPKQSQMVNPGQSTVVHHFQIQPFQLLLLLFATMNARQLFCHKIR